MEDRQAWNYFNYMPKEGKPLAKMTRFYSEKRFKAPDKDLELPYKNKL